MFSKRAPRLLLAAAAMVTAAAVVTAVGVTASGATTASAHARPRLDAPGLHPRAVAAPNPAPTAANTCDYHAAIPADRFKGIPVFNAARAAQPFDVRFFTTQGIITVRC